MLMTTPVHEINNLIAQIGHSNLVHRTRARQQLLEMGSVVVQPLIEAMFTATKPVNAEVASLLTLMDDPRVIVAMLNALTLPNILVAQIAVEALEKHINPALMPAIVDRLPHCRPLVQIHMVGLISRHGDASAVQPLMNLLHTADFSTLRYTIIQALGKLGDPIAIPLIERYANDEDQHVRQRVQTALQRLNERL